MVQLDKDLSLSDCTEPEKGTGSLCARIVLSFDQPRYNRLATHDRRAPILLTLNRMLSPTGPVVALIKSWNPRYVQDINASLRLLAECGKKIAARPSTSAGRTVKYLN